MIDKPTLPASTPQAPPPASPQKISDLINRALSSTSTIVENYSAAIEAKLASKGIGVKVKAGARLPKTSAEFGACSAEQTATFGA